MGTQDQDFFEAVGRLTCAWSQTETILDLIVYVLHAKYGGNHIEKEMPTISLRRKIRYINKCFKRLDRFKQVAEPMRAFMDKYQTAAGLRHDMAHGIVLQHSHMTGETTVARFMRENNTFTHRIISATPAMLAQHTKHISEIGGEGLIVLGLLWVATYLPQNQPQPLPPPKQSRAQQILTRVRRYLPNR